MGSWLVGSILQVGQSRNRCRVVFYNTADQDDFDASNSPPVCAVSETVGKPEGLRNVSLKRQISTHCWLRIYSN